MNDIIQVPRELLEKITPERGLINDEDERICCGEFSNRGHMPDCWWIAIRKLLGDPRFCESPKEEEDEFKIVVTAQQALNKGIDTWEKFCKITGLSDWALAEGMDPSTEFVLTKEQAIKLGVIQ